MVSELFAQRHRSPSEPLKPHGSSSFPASEASTLKPLTTSATISGDPLSPPFHQTEEPTMNSIAKSRSNPALRLRLLPEASLLTTVRDLPQLTPPFRQSASPSSTANPNLGLSSSMAEKPARTVHMLHEFNGGVNRRTPPLNRTGPVKIRSTGDAPPPRPSTAASTGRPPPSSARAGRLREPPRCSPSQHRLRASNRRHLDSKHIKNIAASNQKKTCVCSCSVAAHSKISLIFLSSIASCSLQLVYSSVFITEIVQPVQFLEQSKYSGRYIEFLTHFQLT